MEHHLSYCNRCKKYTAFEDLQYCQLKNNRLLLKGYCSKCTIKKKDLIKFEISYNDANEDTYNDKMYDK